MTSTGEAAPAEHGDALMIEAVVIDTTVIEPDEVLSPADDFAEAEPEDDFAPGPRRRPQQPPTGRTTSSPPSSPLSISTPISPPRSLRSTWMRIWLTKSLTPTSPPTDLLSISTPTSPPADLAGDLDADLGAGDAEAELADAEPELAAADDDEPEAREPDLTTTRPLGSAPLLDSEPLPATMPGMLRPRIAEDFSLPVQRPAFEIGPEQPADR